MLRARADAPNQAFEGAPATLLEIAPEFADALHMLEAGDEVIVLTWLHLADRSVLQTHPRDDESIPLTGVFRTRSSDRRIQIGVHRVGVTAFDGATPVRVDALEAIDGTRRLSTSRSRCANRRTPKSRAFVQFGGIGAATVYSPKPLCKPEVTGSRGEQGQRDRHRGRPARVDERDREQG